MAYLIAVKKTPHYAIKSNFKLRLSMYENVVQGCFIMNKFYSARFGTCYIIQLKNLEEAGRGTREEFDGDGISVFWNNLNIRSL